MGTDHLAEAKKILAGVTAYDPVQFAMAHALIAIAETLHTLEEETRV